LAGAFVVLAICLSGSGSLIAQTAFQRDALLDSGIADAVKLYSRAIGNSTRLYKGFQYKEIEIHEYDVGHPYYLSDDLISGSVVYDGAYFDLVYLQYNLILDKIIVENPHDYSKIELIQSKVSRFSLAQHNFVKLHHDSTIQSLSPSGFYDLLYDGSVKVFAKRTKEIVQKIELGLEKKTFKEKNRYFMYKQGTVFPVKSKSSVIKVLSDRKMVLKREMAKRKIAFNKDPESSIVQMARIYDEPEERP
jgi:hypothetical protein